MTVDEHYLRQLAVSTASLAASTDRPCRIHVLHDGVPAEGRDQVRSAIPDLVELEWIDARGAIRGHALPTRRPRAMFLRLFLGELVPDHLERVLYLDTDLIVRRPLTELWTSDLDDAPVAAIRDAYLPWVFRNATIAWRHLGLSPEAPFFNSGVMLVSLERWRDRSIGRRAAALLSERSPMVDQ